MLLQGFSTWSSSFLGVAKIIFLHVIHMIFRYFCFIVKLREQKHQSGFILYKG